MANTENIEAKLAAYVDGELDAADRAEIEKHLIANPHHRELIEELRQTRSVLRGVPRVSAPPEVAEMLAAHLERAALLGDVELGQESDATSFSRWPQLRAIAAIIFITVGLATALYYILPSPKPSQTHVALVLPEPTNQAQEQSAPTEREVAHASSPAAGASLQGNTSLASNAGTVEQNVRDAHLYIDTPNPNSASEQVTSYLTANGISWRPSNNSSRDRRAFRSLSVDKATASQAPSVLQAPDIAQVDPASINPPTTNQVQQNPPVEIVAEMTAAQADALRTAMSQPQDRQLAQLNRPSDAERGKALRAPSGEENRAKDLAKDQLGAAEAKAEKESPAVVLDDADRTLAPGDTIRVRAAEKNLPGVEPVDETVTVDADGFVTLPSVGRLKIAGTSPRKLADETLPQATTQSTNQTPIELSWTVQRAANAAQEIDKKPPVTQPVLSGIAGPSTQPSGTQPAAQITAAPTTREAVDSKQDDRVEVVIVVRPLEENAITAPAPTNISPAIAAPGDSTATDTSSPNPQATTEPATQPDVTSSAPPTTSPSTEPANPSGDR